MIGGSFIVGIYVADRLHLSKPSSVETVMDATSTSQPDMNDLLGTLTPDFQLMDVSGKLRNISEWRGNVLAINFWASWCKPCLQEIPDFIELQDKYGDQGLQFLGITLDGVEEVQDFVDRFGINYPALVGRHDVIMLAKKFGNHSGGLPYTVIIARDGRINFIKQGALTIEEAEQVIRALL